MQDHHAAVVRRELARTALIDRKTALTILGGSLALLTSTPLLRPAVVVADHDGT
jgi:hypothetical protein